jgi:hypothetical protein
VLFVDPFQKVREPHWLTHSDSFHSHVLRSGDDFDYRCYEGRLYSPIWGEFGATISRQRLTRGEPHVVVVGMISIDPIIPTQRRPNQNKTDPLPQICALYRYIGVCQDLLQEGLQLPARAQEAE